MGGIVDGLDALSRHRCTKVVSLTITWTEASISKVGIIGLDLAKNVFQLHGRGCIRSRSSSQEGCAVLNTSTLETDPLRISRCRAAIRIEVPPGLWRYSAVRKRLVFKQRSVGSTRIAGTR